MTTLFLDDNPERHAIVEQLSPGDIVHCYTVDQFVDALGNPKHTKFDTVSLDHDLGEFGTRSMWFDHEATGMDACRVMVAKEEYVNKLPGAIFIHSVNPAGACAMRAFLERNGYTVRWIPFSA